MKKSIIFSLISFFLLGCPKKMQTDNCIQECEMEKYSCMYGTTYCEQEETKCIQLCK